MKVTYFQKALPPSPGMIFTLQDMPENVEFHLNMGPSDSNWNMSYIYRREGDTLLFEGPLTGSNKGYIKQHPNETGIII